MKKLFAIMIAVVMVVFAAVPAFAAEADVISPTATAPSLEYKVTVIPTGGGDGDYEFKSGIDENGQQWVEITPIPNPGYKFDHWDIEGPYTTDDELTVANMRLIITGDIVVTPYFVKDGEVETGTASPDKSPTSPQTGSKDFMAYAVVFLSIAACGAAMVMFVKTSKISR